MNDESRRLRMTVVIGQGTGRTDILARWVVDVVLTTAVVVELMHHTGSVLAVASVTRVPQAKDVPEFVIDRRVVFI